MGEPCSEQEREHDRSTHELTRVRCEPRQNRVAPHSMRARVLMRRTADERAGERDEPHQHLKEEVFRVGGMPNGERIGGEDGDNNDDDNDGGDDPRD